MDKPSANSINTHIFSPELEALISKNNIPINRNQLKLFLTTEHLPLLTENILEDSEWDIFELVTASILLENKTDEFLSGFLEAVGNFVYQNDEKRDKVSEILLEGFAFASPPQLKEIIELLNKLQEHYSLADEFIPSILYENITQQLQFGMYSNRD